MFMQTHLGNRKSLFFWRIYMHCTPVHVAISFHRAEIPGKGNQAHAQAFNVSYTLVRDAAVRGLPCLLGAK